jgi:hypothetical protein
VKETISVGGVAISEFGNVSDQTAQEPKTIETEPLPEPVADKPNPEPSKASEKSKPSKLKSAGDAFANLLMGIGVFITGGIFGLIGYRSFSIRRLTIEAVVFGLIATVMYFTTTTWLHPYTEALDLGDPLQRAVLFVVGAIILAYVGGMVVHVGWSRKGDPKMSMLVLAVGMTLIGLRIASLAMAFGEIKTVDAKVEAGAAGLKALTSTVDIMKAEGVDPKPVAALIMDFHKSIYGNKYVEAFYGITNKEKLVVPDQESLNTDEGAKVSEAPTLQSTEAQPPVEPFHVEPEAAPEGPAEGVSENSPSLPEN